MTYSPLGGSGLIVSRACLGTMVFGEESDRGADETTSVSMIRQFVDAGGNFIDTADVYAGGASERIVGEGLRDLPRDQLVVATKVRMPAGKGPNDIGLSRKHITDGLDESLRRLGTDYVDLYYTHMWDPVTPLDETLRALDDLVRAGKVRYIGVSNFAAWQLMKALSLSGAMGYVPYVAAQYQHSLVLRDIERNWRTLDAVGRVAEERGATYSQVALAWLLGRPTVSSVLLGVRTPEQLADNLGAVDIELSEEEYAALDEASAMELGYPYRMIAEHGARRL